MSAGRAQFSPGKFDIAGWLCYNGGSSIKITKEGCHMKKILAIVLALFLLLSTCALAVPVIDAAQLTTPLQFQSG